jgi:hypothetical protein
LLGQLERQTASNLRQSFAVVGMLAEKEVFYKMLDARVAYINPFLNQHIEGKHHSASKTGVCKNVFGVQRNDTFQMLLDLSPESSVLQRFFEVATEVNQIQEKRASAMLN